MKSNKEWLKFKKKYLSSSGGASRNTDLTSKARTEGAKLAWEYLMENIEEYEAKNKELKLKVEVIESKLETMQIENEAADEDSCFICEQYCSGGCSGKPATCAKFEAKWNDDEVEELEFNDIYALEEEDE